MRRAIRSGTRTALEGAGVGPEGRWTGVGRAAPGVRYCLRRLGACGLALMLLVACSPEGGAEARGDARVSRAAVGDEVRREDTRPVVLFLGTSLTAGYGLPESEAFPARIQARIDAAGLDYRVVNAGVSGDTSAGGLRRLDWLLRLPVAVLVLELGANDMLRGQGVDALRANLEAIVDRTRAAHPDARIVIAGMRAAPNLGPDYARAFDAVYPELAERAGAALVPFLLEDVAARRELNQADGIHPTADGHARIAERIWQTLEPVLQERVGSDRVLDPH
ncbi:MAG: arylesterase [Myxococcales bacterium]|nr:arylesterase [Myxococcales bacterium]